MFSLRKRFLFTALLLAISQFAFGNSGDWPYTVKSGHSLWSICDKYVARPLCFIELGDYNALPRHNLIAPGAQIKIPYAWLKTPPQPAVVLWQRGEVGYIPAQLAAKQAWEKLGTLSNLAALTAAGVSVQALPADGKLYVGDRIITGEGSVGLRFADGSELTLMPQSDLKLAKITAGADSEFIESEMSLRRGSTRNRVHEKTESDRYRITTPAGVAAVRGTEFRVSVAGQSGGVSADDENRAVMLSEVLNGRVQVANDRGDSAAAVAAGYGVRNEAGQAVPEPRKLLPPPEIKDPETMQVLQPFTIAWTALAGATTYQIELYKNAELISSSNINESAYVFSGFDEGEYQIKVRGIDDVGLQGLDANVTLQTYSSLSAVALNQSQLVAHSGRAFSIDWQDVPLASSYQVEVARDADFSEILDKSETAASNFEYRSKQPVFIRVTAKAHNGVMSETSDAVIWQPEQEDNIWLLLGGFALLVAVVLL